MIEVSHLDRNYGALKAVGDVSFSIQSGEIIGLLGPNGAGKTTIMKMICGFLEPSAGKVRIDGIDVAENATAAQKRIGYLPENLPVYPDMTVVGYLDYAAGLRGLDGDDKARDIRRVIDATDLRAKAFSKIADLSRGLKQRVGVAQALLGSPSVLVLDEPTNGLDPAQTQEMRKLIKALAEHATVILSTHILSEVEAVCDRVLMVRSGRLVLDSRLDDLQQSAALSIQTSLSDSKVQTAIEATQGIAKFEVLSVGDTTNAKVTLTDPAQMRQVTAQLAKAIVEAGGELYQLHSEQRDLESLFNDTAGGVAHAA